MSKIENGKRGIEGGSICTVNVGTISIYVSLLLHSRRL